MADEDEDNLGTIPYHLHLPTTTMSGTPPLLAAMAPNNNLTHHPLKFGTHHHEHQVLKPIVNASIVLVRATADGGAELAGDPKLDIFTE